jgi:hypothetical protein
MSAKRNSGSGAGADSGDEHAGDACKRCGRVHIMISVASLHTERDCRFMDELDDIGRSILSRVLAYAGVDISSVPTDRMTEMERMLYFWRIGKRDYVRWRESAEGKAALARTNSRLEDR